MNIKEAEKNARKYFEGLGEEIPTVSGLALAIGLKSRSELLNYTGGGKMERVIGDSLLRLESILESRLYNKETYHGAKTVLQSNFGWQESGEDSKEQTILRVKRILEGVGD